MALLRELLLEVALVYVNLAMKVSTAKLRLLALLIASMKELLQVQFHKIIVSANAPPVTMG